MTLVELLVTIVIISILASMILGVASIAGETAREAETRHVVARLHTLLTAYYDTFKTRRVKLSGIQDEIDDELKSNPPNRGVATAEARLYALRELMLMEVPDRWSDVLLQNVSSGTSAVTTPGKPVYLDTTGTPNGNGRSTLAGVYLRRYLALAARVNSAPDRAKALAALLENQSAECLYMVVTLACGDGEARTLFGEGNIGDTDGDGAPEFLDGWGQPIHFIRWAPGFDSLIQINANTLAGDSTSPSNDWIIKSGADHDPYDVFRVDPAAFRLVPLIYSAGRDEEYGIYDGADILQVWPDPTSAKVGPKAPYITPALNPYKKLGSPSAYLGTDLGEGTAADNVHNHLLGQR